MQPTFWFFNTDESEAEGENAHELMIHLSRVAAWGDCHGVGAEQTLKPPTEGDRVFLYRAGHGIVASGLFTDAPPFASQDIFGQRGEFHRAIEDLCVPTEPLSAAEILSESGYFVPARHILCRILDTKAVAFLATYFERVGQL